MLKIAIIKFGGLAAGGTERFLQEIACLLPKKEFKIDFYYCDSAPYIGSDWKHPDTDPFRKKYLEENNVNLIKFNVSFKNITIPTHDWIGTDFWEKFNENDYDVIISGRAGHPEYPFNKILKKPIINILTLVAGVDNQKNIFKSIQISNWAGEQWVNSGGDRNRLEIIPIFQQMPRPPFNNLRNKLGLDNKFIYGFHQRDNDEIFSDIPLSAYKKIETDDTAFIILGGSQKYKEQAQDLHLKHFIKLEHSGDTDKIHSFLATIDVFSHGRNDGETFGAVFTEAMYHKKPCLSHKSFSNGHIEVIGECGKVFERHDINGYSDEMLKLKNDSLYYKNMSNLAHERYKNNYSLEKNIDKIISILKSIPR